MNYKDWYSVYADYGMDDSRNHEYNIGNLEQTQKWVQDVLDMPETTLKNVGQLTLTIRHISGKVMSVHKVTKP